MPLYREALRLLEFGRDDERRPARGEKTSVEAMIWSRKAESQSGGARLQKVAGEQATVATSTINK